MLELLASGRASQAIEMVQQLDLGEAAEIFMALLPHREAPNIRKYRPLSGRRRQGLASILRMAAMAGALVYTPDWTAAMAYVEIQLETGTAIIETEDQPGAQPISALADNAGRALGAIESSLTSIQELATRITQRLGAAVPDSPDEIELTFGIKASAEVNALVIAKAQGEANYTVRLKWTRPKAPA